MVFAITSANINCMFKAIFPDSNVASAFSMAPTKVLYFINHGLATHFKQILKDGITKSDCYIYGCYSYIVTFDESLYDITQRCRMNILVRYWDSNDSVKVRCWTSSLLGHSTDSNLPNHFNESLSGLDKSKMLCVNGWTCNKLEVF